MHPSVPWRHIIALVNWELSQSVCITLAASYCREWSWTKERCKEPLKRLYAHPLSTPSPIVIVKWKEISIKVETLLFNGETMQLYGQIEIILLKF